MTGKEFLNAFLSGTKKTLFRRFAETPEGQAMHEKQLARLNSVHPRNIVVTKPTRYAVFGVNFSYVTQRGRETTGTRVFIVPGGYPETDTEKLLTDYVSGYNKEYSNRQLLNVQILDSCFVGYDNIA